MCVLFRLYLQIDARKDICPLTLGHIHKRGGQDMKLLKSVVRVITFRVSALYQFFASSTSSCISLSKLFISSMAETSSAY